MRDALIEHTVDRGIERQRDFLAFPQRRRQRHTGERAPRQRVVDRPGHQTPRSEPGKSLGTPQAACRQVLHAVHQRTEVLAEQRVGDHAQRGLDHRRVHVELDLWDDVGGYPLDRVDHQVDQLVEMAARERGIQRRPMGRPRIALVGQQVDTGCRADRFVLVGLDVFQPGSVQHVVDVVGVCQRHEASSRATESGDVVTANMREEAAGGVEPDGDGVARHRPGTQPLRWCRHEFNGTSDRTDPEWDYRTGSWEFRTGDGGDGMVS